MNYPSIKEEYVDPVPAKLTGSLPSWLSGSLYRNGPGLLEVGECKYNHLFDGLGKVHKFSIKDGAVTYQSRFIQSNTYKKNTEANRIVITEFGTLAVPDPCKNIFQRMATRFKIPEPTDNTLVNVYPIGDALYTATETNIISRLDWDTLDTMNSLDISKLVAVNSATAHPHIERDGTVYNLGNMHKDGRYAIIKIKPKQGGATDDKEGVVETAEILGSVPAQSKLKPAYFHSFALTENYVVMIENPLMMNVLKMLTCNMRGKPFVGAMEWNPKLKSIFHVLDKHTGKIVNEGHTYEADSFFTFHHANAYEENGCLVVDCCAFTDGSIISQVDLAFLTDPANAKAISEMPAARVRRYVLPLNLEGKEGDQLVQIEKCTATAVLKKGKKVHLTHQQLCDIDFEFPRINYGAVNGQKYRYLYGVTGNPQEQYAQQLIRLDIETGEQLKWGEAGHSTSEPVFVAKPDGEAEDDGVILSIALSPMPDKKAFLVVVDASNMQELARAEVDVKVHRDFHGEFFADK